MVVPIALGAAALWIYFRRSRGLPILPHFGHVPHVEVLTPGGPALVPATTQVIPVTALSPQGALSLAQAAAQAQVGDPGIHAPRYLLGGGLGSAAQGALGSFDVLDYVSAPRGLERDELGIYRSRLSRPFGAR